MRNVEAKVLYIIVDQLAGHWAKGVKVEEEFPPANVAGYHDMGLVPSFSYLIEEGIWVKKPWNKGVCDTPHGMKYLATGTYKHKTYWIGNYRGKGMFYPEGKDEEGELIPEDTKAILTKVAQDGIKLSTVSGRPLEQQYRILKIDALGLLKGWPHALIVNESEIYLLNKNGYEPVESWNDKIHGISTCICPE